MFFFFPNYKGSVSGIGEFAFTKYAIVPNVSPQEDFDFKNIVFMNIILSSGVTSAAIV